MAIPVLETYQASDSGGATATSLVCAVPSGIVAGDLLVIIVGDDADNQTGAMFDALSGWTKLGESGDGNDAHIALYWKEAAGGETAETVGHSAAADELWGLYLRISGADTTSPIDVSNFGTASAGNPQVATAVTTGSANCLVLAGLASDGGDIAPYTVSGSGWVEVAEVTSGTSGQDAGGCVAERDQASAGAGVDCTFTGAASDGCAFLQVAIKEASGGAALLAAAVSGSATVAATLTTAITAVAAITASAVVAAALTTAITVAGVTSAQGTVAGAISTNITPKASITTQATASGTLFAGAAAEFAAAVTGSGTTAGALTTEIKTAGALSASGTVAGAISTAITPKASIGSQATVTGTVVKAEVFAAGVTGAGTVAGALTTAIPLAGAPAASGSVAGALTTEITVASAINVTATVAASLTAPGSAVVSNLHLRGMALGLNLSI